MHTIKIKQSSSGQWCMVSKDESRWQWCTRVRPCLWSVTHLLESSWPFAAFMIRDSERHRSFIIISCNCRWWVDELGLHYVCVTIYQQNFTASVIPLILGRLRASWFLPMLRFRQIFTSLANAVNYYWILESVLSTARMHASATWLLRTITHQHRLHENLRTSRNPYVVKTQHTLKQAIVEDQLFHKVSNILGTDQNRIFRHNEHHLTKSRLVLLSMTYW